MHTRTYHPLGKDIRSPFHVIHRHAYCQSGNFRIVKFLLKICFNYFLQKFCGPEYPRKFFDELNWFNIPRFDDLEWDYTCQENMEYEQFTAFVATMQLFVDYSHAKRMRNTVGTYCGSTDSWHWEHRITEGTMYVLPIRWYVRVCMCPTFNVICNMCTCCM